MDKELYNIVYKIIEKYDPISIADFAKDEYKPETIDIANRCYVLTEERLCQYIKEVFEFWFGENLSANKDNIYKCIASEIKNKLDKK